MSAELGLNRYGYNAIARHLSTAIISAVLVFLAAGKLDWFGAWFYNIVHFLGWLGLSLILAAQNPALLNERGRPTKRLMSDAQAWDRPILIAYSLLLLLQPIAAGLDKRFAWSADAGLWFYILGNAILLISFVILTWSMVVNRHFEPVARIQEEKNHQVISSGIYHYVRHPGYLAVILNFLGTAMALSSWAALLVGIVGSILFVVRTAFEDKMLQDKLEGYSEFAKHTRYRLIPYVW